MLSFDYSRVADSYFIFAEHNLFYLTDVAYTLVL